MTTPSSPALRTHMKDLIVRSCGLTHVDRGAESATTRFCSGPKHAGSRSTASTPVEIAVNIQMEYGREDGELELRRASTSSAPASLADHVRIADEA